jgi:hypothetical protein
MTEISYIVDDLYSKLNEIKTSNDTVDSFFETFSFEQVINRKNEKNNSINVFKDTISKNGVKSDIIKILNKVNQNNIDKSASDIKNIEFLIFEDYKELVRQCIGKIKNTNEQMRYYIGLLCSRLHYLFNNSDKKKVNFEDLLLSATRYEYVEFINFDIDGGADKRILLVVSTLYDVKILDDSLISKIFDDFKNFIKFDEKKTNYESIEFAIHHLCYFIHSLGFNTNLLLLSDNIDKFLNEEVLLYDKNISKKTRLTIENTIEEIYKKINSH